MESVCYSCGSHVAGQAPFCSSCGAPQIRVPAREIAIEELPQASPAPLSATERPVAPPPVPVPQKDWIRWRTFLRVAVPFAAVVGISQAVIPALALLLLPGSVIVAIQLYRRRQPGPLIPMQGAKMGATLGLLGFGVGAVLLTLRWAGDPAGVRQEVAMALARSANPEAQHMGQALISSTGGLVLLLVSTMIFILVLLLVIGTVSGALAARLFREKTR